MQCVLTNMLVNTFIEELNEVFNDLSSLIRCDRCYHNHSFNVIYVIKQLKQNKSDGNRLWSNNLIFACHRLYAVLNLLFNSMLVHSFSPGNMRVSTIIPIPKSTKKSLNDSSNYRSIALGSVIGKVFDLLILNTNGEVLKSSVT